jgi:hypothetical protein
MGDHMNNRKSDMDDGRFLADKLQTLRDQLHQAFARNGPIPDRRLISRYVERLQNAIQAGDHPGGLALSQLVLYLLLASDEPLADCLSLYDRGGLMMQAGLSLQDGITPLVACVDLAELALSTFGPGKIPLSTVEHYLRLAALEKIYPFDHLEKQLMALRENLEHNDELADWLCRECTAILDGIEDPEVIQHFMQDAIDESGAREIGYEIDSKDRASILMGAMLMELFLGDLSPEEVIGLKKRLQHRFGGACRSLFDLPRQV